MKKQYIVYVLLAVGLVFSLFMWTLTEKEKKAYERFLSDQLVNQVVLISQSPLYNLGILQEVIESGKLTRAQAGELELGFRDIAFETQDVVYMAHYIGRLENYSDDSIVSVNADYMRYFNKLKLNMECDEIELTDEHIEVLEKMEKLMQKYHDVNKDIFVVTEQVGTKGVPEEFWNIYREKGISDDYWIKLLKEYEKVTDNRYRLN